MNCFSFVVLDTAGYFGGEQEAIAGLSFRIPYNRRGLLRHEGNKSGPLSELSTFAKNSRNSAYNSLTRNEFLVSEIPNKHVLA
jgi:hypothetical protein